MTSADVTWATKFFCWPNKVSHLWSRRLAWTVADDSWAWLRVLGFVIFFLNFGLQIAASQIIASTILFINLVIYSIWACIS